jgi:hypothetical protein
MVGLQVGASLAQTEQQTSPEQPKVHPTPRVVKLQAPNKGWLTVGTETKPTDLWATMLMFWLGPGNSDQETLWIYNDEDNEVMGGVRARPVPTDSSPNMPEEDGSSDILGDMHSRVVMP